MTSNETELSNAAEDALESEMPTRELALDEAAQWLALIAENEGVDHPLLSKDILSRNVRGLAFSEEWCISVRKNKSNQLLLLHEMSHLVCANKNHGVEFRSQLVRFLRRYVSLAHAVRLHEMYVAAGLGVEPFAATK